MPQAPTVTLSPDTKSRLNAILGEVAQSGYPSTILGVVNTAGDEIFLSGTDETKLDSVHWAASLTKLVTSIAALQLVEAGKLTLDESLGDIAPELSHRAKFVNADPEDLRTMPAETDITLRHLLTHTSGLSYGVFNAKTLAWIQKTYGPESTKYDPLDMPLVFEPGTGFEYGIGSDWAGRVVERVTGQSLGAYVERHIFDPLGVADAAFCIEEHPALAARLAGLHVKTAAGFAEVPYPEVLTRPETESGGGGLWATPRAYLALLSALLNGGVSPRTGHRILRPATLEAMFAPQTLDVPGQGALAPHGALPTAVPAFSERIPLLPGQRKAWTLAHLTNLEPLPNGRTAGSAEWYGLASLFWTLDRGKGVAAVAFGQVFPFGVSEFFEIVERLQEVVFAPGALEQVGE